MARTPLYGHTDEDYFRMGAAVAIGGLLSEEMLKGGRTSADKYLASFGITSVEDAYRLGIHNELYLSELEGAGWIERMDRVGGR